MEFQTRLRRSFVAIRRLTATLPQPNPAADIAQMRRDFEDLKLDIEEILHDQNDINESTRAQLDAISDALIELQSQGKHPRKLPEIGYTAIQKRREEEK